MPAAVTPPRQKPLVTANQVTFARLLLLPIGSYFMYQGLRGQWFALFFMIVVGSTDFVDGWLARRYGPTVLGGLMDPIADKVFVVVTLIPAVDLGWLPWYLIALLFAREFIVTAARTVYERRRVSLKTSYLAKVKTWFQMCGVGIVFLLSVVQTPSRLSWTLGFLALAPVAGGLLYYAIRRQRWRGSIWFAICFGTLWACYEIWGARHVTVGIGWAMLAITLASGGAYLFGLRELPGTGRVDAHDVVRLFGALTLPSLALWLVSFQVAPSWPLIVALAFEFATGGLDNLLAHHGRLSSWLGWAARVVPQALLLTAAIPFARRGEGGVVFALTLGALAITALSSGILFYRRRDVYLGALAASDQPAPKPALDTASRGP